MISAAQKYKDEDMGTFQQPHKIQLGYHIVARRIGTGDDMSSTPEVILTASNRPEVVARYFVWVGFGDASH